MSMSVLVRLPPGVWTAVPNTSYELRWDGEEDITIYWRSDDTFTLSPPWPPWPPGCLLARKTYAGQPITPSWPIFTNTRGTDQHDGHTSR